MRKYILLCFCWTFLFLTSAFAESYKSEHFIIHSDLDPRYIRFVQANAEAYYRNMVGRCFRTGWRKPLAIYYSKTHSDTFRLLREHGHKLKARHSYYIPSVPAIYTHQFTKEGGRIGWGTLFHEITHHFVRLNFQNPPAWFNEGLACFFGNETQVVNGRITLGLPEPGRERKLRERIEKGIRPNIKRLYSMSREELYNWPAGYHFSRALFYWLYETGELKEYLWNVQRKGYAFAVLEETVSKSYKEIHAELLAFIKSDCYAGACLKDGRLARDNNSKKEAFRKALDLRPYYHSAHFELANCHYRAKDYSKCRAHLQRILADPGSIEYRRAAKQMGHSYYCEKDYARALEYYQIAVEYSEYDEYKYELYYWMANCHRYLKDNTTAEKYYKMYLDNNWEPEKHSTRVAYAKEYQKWNEENSAEEKASGKQKEE